ncbi:type II toxin-antitoxin system PemK/MazF family toxin [Methylocystis sp. WRRC1]|uniref:type II toxin-antitoxin system PemK/MazF family toxin n=1 Tax=Methylocystis sp. WRRC1 TaxID=1732014 RepID=UPI001D15610C|nr:type II toxin-antitoxin system PemK/MazF family toxin [Methylocystis sp. WRRC1]MCC3246343.1 type II toxin-antitoxin system PemK/MazF family toxin [Methylocystis sp. WRRC1]
MAEACCKGKLLIFPSAGTQTTGVIRCDQPRALDLSARRAKKLESAPDDIVAEALAKLAAILE